MVLNHNSRILSSIIVVVVVVMTGSPADFHFPYQIKNPRDPAPAPQESVNTWDKLGLTKFWSDWVRHDMMGWGFYLYLHILLVVPFFCCSIIIIIIISIIIICHFNFGLNSPLHNYWLLRYLDSPTKASIVFIQYPTRSRMSRKENSNTVALIF